jgi:predicted small secreted protein
VLVLAIACAWLPAGCNTVEGAGRDLQSGGKLIQDAARGTSDALSGER